MANLIDHEQHCWRTKIIDGMFLPFEVNVIKAIPLSLVDTPNWIYWSKNRNGVYFVKSEYKLIMENEEIDAPGGSDPTLRKKVWKKSGISMFQIAFAAFSGV